MPHATRIPRRTAVVALVAIALAGCDLVAEPDGPRPEDFVLSSATAASPPPEDLADDDEANDGRGDARRPVASRDDLRAGSP